MLSSQNGHPLLSLLPQLQHSLEALPEFKLRHSRTSKALQKRGVDAEIEAEIEGQRVRLLVQCKQAGYPRDLARAAVELESWRDFSKSEAVVPLVLAPSISPGARLLLQQHGVTYWDASGSIYLKLPHALYFVDHPPPRQDRRIRSLFRGRMAQVIHTILIEPGRSWPVRELAAASETSVFTVHQVLKHLEEQLWMDRRGEGPRMQRHLREPGALLDAWAEEHSLRRYTHHRYHSLARSPAALSATVAGLLARLNIPYACTLDSGANLVAPGATGGSRLSLIVPESSLAAFDQAVAASGVRPVDDGENIVLLASRERSPLMFRQQVEHLWVASNVQLYLDLWAWPRRGREQARHLRATRLPY